MNCFKSCFRRFSKEGFYKTKRRSDGGAKAGDRWQGVRRGRVGGGDCGRGDDDRRRGGDPSSGGGLVNGVVDGGGKTVGKNVGKCRLSQYKRPLIHNSYPFFRYNYSLHVPFN